MAARARTTAMTTAGRVLVVRWSWRHCNAYCISRRSCGPSTPSRMISSAVTATSSNRRTNTSMAGRPLARQVLAWAWQSGNAACGHSRSDRPADRTRRRRLDRRRVGQPPVQVGSPGAVPPLPVQLTHPAARDPVAAPGDPTARVRALPAPPRIGRRGEHVQVRAARADPAQVMALAHARAAGGPPAALDPAGSTAEHRVLGGEHEHLGAELGPDRAQQLLQQRRSPRHRRPGRRRPSQPHRVLSANQPARSNAPRASSTLRCP